MESVLNSTFVFDYLLEVKNEMKNFRSPCPRCVHMPRRPFRFLFVQVLGESTDLLWAPISYLLIDAMYRESTPWAGVSNHPRLVGFRVFLSIRLFFLCLPPRLVEMKIELTTLPRLLSWVNSCKSRTAYLFLLGDLNVLRQICPSRPCMICMICMI